MNKARLRIIRLSFFSRFIYTEAILVQIITNFLLFFVQLYIWKAIYSTNNLNSYMLDDMIAYIILVQVLRNIYSTGIQGNVAMKIRTGKIGISLLNPMSLIETLFFESIGNILFRTIVTNIPMYILATIYIKVDFDIMHIINFVLLVLIGCIFIFLFDFIFGLLTFFTQCSWGIANLRCAIMLVFAGQMMPIDLYPKFLRMIVDLMPFKYLYSEPINILLGKNSSISILVFILWTVFLIVSCKVLYGIAIKRVVVQGG